MQSQVGLMKHHYEQSSWRWWNSCWTISNPKRWCCESTVLTMSANLENSTLATGLEKISFHSSPKQRQCQRMLKLISHVSKVVLKILQAKFQQYVNCEIPDVQAEFTKGRGTRVVLCQHPLDHRKNKWVAEKHLLLLYWLYQSLWLCGSQQTLKNSSRDGNTRTS